LNLNLEKDKKNVVITLGGCFYPLHKNHINILERGKQLIEKMKE
jgi:glycerol-3-phosphate cytidylyltransferase-like family protein